MSDHPHDHPALPPLPAGDPGGGSTPAACFDLLWTALADIMGTAATATLLRRAAKYATPHTPALQALRITRQDLTYAYCLPPAWQHPADPQAWAALHALVRALRPLLIELTGAVVVRRLAQLAPLRAAGLSLEEPST